MKIKDLVTLIKSQHRGVWHDVKIDEETTKDRILYGDAEQECTGIVTAIYASPEVIKKAHELGANLIISHEALFWNHGDHTDWLTTNKSFIAKKRLLDDYGIVVWRDHDYIHSGIKINNEWYDGIRYGVMKELGWEKYLIEPCFRPLDFHLPRMKTTELTSELMTKMQLSGIKCIGNSDGYSEYVSFAHGHIFGPAESDNAQLKFIEDNNVDTIISMELTDFTVGLYVRDSALLGIDKKILAIGHFNVEQPGMKYFAKYLPEMIGTDINVTFVSVNDMYSFITKE
jgi:hypothetical protein